MRGSPGSSRPHSVLGNKAVVVPTVDYHNSTYSSIQYINKASDPFSHLVCASLGTTPLGNSINRLLP